MLRGVIDRVEETGGEQKLAVIVLDDEQQLVVPVEELPPGARAGMAVVLLVNLDPEDTRQRAERIRRLQGELFG